MGACKQLREIIIKSRIIGGAIACCILVHAGCGNKEQSLNWRRDVSPIIKRIPVLSCCTNMLWHGEIITKNSFMSPPGPSAYRVCCFIPDASRKPEGQKARGSELINTVTSIQ